MSLLMIGSFPLLMTVVLMIAVWAERFLADQDDLVPIEDSFDAGRETIAQAGMAVPAGRAAMVNKPEI
jgi:hypothetical protein